jgi:3-phosphoshikimate 1-carboxyvinyltransferase
MPIASAQVKSAILLAGLYAQGTTRITELIPTRDHTERLLKFFNIKVKKQGKTITLSGKQELSPRTNLYIPGDISSASFFIILTAILAKSRIMIKNVSLNPTRIGLLRVLKRMGIRLKIKKIRSPGSDFEPRGDIFVESSSLRGTLVGKEEIPSLIDELPVLMVAACFAKGKTVLENIGELRVKETDRIKSMAENLRKMKAKIKISKLKKSEDIVIKGVGQLQGAHLRSYADHRTAMSAIVAGMKAVNSTHLDDVSCINKSFPGFLTILRSLR